MCRSMQTVLNVICSRAIDVHAEGLLDWALRSVYCARAHHKEAAAQAERVCGARHRGARTNGYLDGAIYDVVL